MGGDAVKRDSTIEYRDEDPVLIDEHALQSAAVAFHVVEDDCDRMWMPSSPTPDSYPGCRYFSSMELDLLSYGFQRKSPFGSQCEITSAVPVVVRFPGEYVFWSEGEADGRICPPAAQTRRLHALVSRTLFFQSGITVWHVVFSPAPGEPFTELDIVKLIHIYDGRTEAPPRDATGEGKRRLRDTIRFQVDGKTQWLDVTALLTTLCSRKEGRAGRRRPTELRLEAGTVMVLASPHHAELLETVKAARSVTDSVSYRRAIVDWMHKDQRGAMSWQGAVLSAYCGIVQGIFDYPEIGDEELRDILDATVPESGPLLRVHRATLTVIAADPKERVLNQCRETIGISPYLLIPHALLLHEEAIIDCARHNVRKALRNGGTPTKLERQRKRVARILHGLHVPNVFNYLTERAIYDRGLVIRGADQRRRAAEAQLAELDQRIEARWNERKVVSEAAVAALLAVVSFLQLKDILSLIIDRVYPEPVSDVAKLVAAGALAMVLGGIVFALLRRGVRRSPGSES